MDQQELDFLTQQKIDLIISMKTKKFAEEINTLKEHIRNLQGDILQLRKEIAQRPISTEPIIRAVEDTGRESRPDPTPPPRVEKKPPHPRQGNYTSKDVSIEKFFNFSGK